MANDIDSMNPFLGYLAEAYEVWGSIYDQLTGYSQKDLTPALAESWTASPDGKIWTYKIRQGVKWSDGQPLTAKDVAYSFNRVKNGETEQTNYGTYVEHLESVTAPDDTTVAAQGAWTTAAATIRCPSCAAWPSTTPLAS